LIVTNGSQEALALVAQAFIKPGDSVIIERKGYPPAWRLFENLGARLIPISVDREGLCASEVADVMKKRRVKLIYTTPLHQYPTTVTLSPRRRQELIDLAENHRVPILEDDYDHEFHYLSPPPTPISAETFYGIYVCSFSKILFPGARLGIIACNPDLKEHLSYQKYLVSRQTDCLSQLALARWIQEGGFERHLRRVRREYEKRYYFMLSQLEEIRRENEIEWHSPSGGMSFWVDLKRNSRLIAEKAKQQGVLFQCENEMDYKKTDGSHLRIGFAGLNKNEIKDGLTVLRGFL
jgi:GntR family transcriptional regulator/MocR family aminotransferase